MLTGNPFDDLRTLLADLPAGDTCAGRKISEGLATKPVDVDGGLAALAMWLGTWQGTASPSVAQSHICLFASSYAGFGDGVDVRAFVDATAKGAAPVNLLCVDKGIGLRAIELAPEMPHDAGASWREADCMAAVAFGMEATAAGGDLLALTDMAPGGDAHALAVILACDRAGDLTAQCEGEPLFDAAGRILAAAGEATEGRALDPLTALRCCGGREIAAAVGALVAARSRRLPVLVDGWAGLAAVAVLEAASPGAADHVQIAAVEDACQKVFVAALGKPPLLGTGIGAGPGAACALAVSVLSAACAMQSLRGKG
jgi:nicotinate-nucleotide--dimethylbenzimidazole phosphoribosyltransferase